MEGAIILEINKRIKQYRTDKSFTLQELADLSGVTKGMISQIENGRSIPSLPVLLNIVNALDINLSEFFKDINQREDLVLITRKSDYEPFQKKVLKVFSMKDFSPKR